MLRNNTAPLLLIILLSVLTLVLALLSESTYEGGDSIQHFLISKYAFAHPQLLLDPWGRPLFTLLSAPFSQAGFAGICLFNILCAAGTAWAAWRIVSQLGLSPALPVIFFVFFAPVYYVTLISGLTEPLFGLLITLAVLLTINGRYAPAALVASLLPFVRSEGFLMLPLFALVFVLRKAWLPVPLLAAGTVLYSLIGSFHYGDLLWVFNQNPYAESVGMYSTGPLMHFIRKNEFILGTPLVVLFVAGMVRLGIAVRRREGFFPEELWLVFGGFFVYLAAHSLVYYIGFSGVHSVGLIRVMAGVTPLAAITCAGGLHLLLKSPGKREWIKTGFTVLVIAFSVWMPFKQHQFPRKLNYEEQPVKQACDFIREQGLQSQRMHYMFPYAAVFLDFDPFDEHQAVMLWSIPKEQLAAKIPSGGIVIWDSHYSPVEGKMPLEALQNDSFELLKSFAANPADVPKDVGSFEVHVFKKK